MRERTSGILLHPTSLPERHGVGDLGPTAHRFADRLADAGLDVWQMLPVTPAGAHGSPYDCRATRAGDRLLISPEAAARRAGVELPDDAGPSTGGLDDAAGHKDRLLRALWNRLRDSRESSALRTWREAPEQRGWLEDWTLFAALDRRFAGRHWTEWPPQLRDRLPEALARARRDLAEEIDYQAYLQFVFADQFEALREHVHGRGLRLCGDLPMYPAHHSVDVWCHRELFELTETGHPAAAAGVPPDAYSDDGQLWGNPVYRWSSHRRSKYRWWVERLRTESRRFDLLRLDHFRGFLAFWRVPLPADDARGGRWRRGPGRPLFDAFERELGSLELIAEDLGHITPAVRRLRRRLGFPGIRVIQFGFDSHDSEHLPERYDAATVAYSGTHDNDTLIGWLDTLDPEARGRVSSYLAVDPATPDPELAERLVRRLFDSPAGLVILPAQDALGLGTEARMNTPGTIVDNWRWRLRPGQFDRRVVARLAGLIAESDRGGRRT